MNIQELTTKIRALIAKDEIEKAIKELSAYFKDDNRLDDIILQSGRYHSALKEKGKGTVGFEEVNKILNQLRENILDLLNAEEERHNYKEQVFEADNIQAHEGLIPVFFSVGSPHKDSQVDYIEKLKAHLLKYQIDLRTLDDDDWDSLDPLKPIKRKMESCQACLVLAMERFHVNNGAVKRGSKQEKVVKDQSYATPWTHIEATMAYQLDMPFIILKENTLQGEGMLDDNLFEWRIVRVDPSKPEELDQYPVKSFLRMWIEEVKKGKKHAED
jgi:hypothetical protein